MRCWGNIWLCCDGCLVCFGSVKVISVYILRFVSFEREVFLVVLIVRRSSLGSGSFFGGGIEGIILVLAVVRLSLCYSLCSIRSSGSLCVNSGKIIFA